jgi:photosystem II stability/assembly factor-like uncharacterized protein
MPLACLLAVVLSAPGPWVWQPVPLGGGGPVTCLAVSPTDAGLLLAGGLGVIERSTDGGRSWQLADAGLAGRGDRACAALAFHPTDARLAFVALGEADAPGGGGLFVSEDAGVSWSARSREPRFSVSGPRAQTGHVLAFAPLDPGLLWAATINRGVCASDDGGRHWTSLGPAGAAVTSLARAADGTLFALLHAAAGAPMALARRAPDEPDWAVLDQGDLLDVAVGEGHRLLLASRDKGLRLSDDGGLTWTNVTPAGLDLGSGAAVVAFSPSHPRVGVALGGSRAWRTAWLTLDGGAGWQPLLTPPAEHLDLGDGWLSGEQFAARPRCAAFDPHTPRRLWLGDELDVWGTHDGAATWFSGHAGLSTAVVESLATDPRRPGHGYVGTASAGAFEAQAEPAFAAALGGNGVEVRDVPALAVADTSNPSDAAGSGGLIIANGDVGAWRLAGPSHWVACGALPGALSRLARLPDGGILGETTAASPLASHDAGAGWQPWGTLDGGLPLLLDAGGRRAAMRAHSGGLWLTNDGGAQWSRLDANLPPAPAALDGDMAVLPGRGGALFAVHGGAVWRTRDDGELWERMLPRPVTRLAGDAALRRVYAAPADTGGVLASDDLGETWQPVLGLPAAEVLAMVADPLMPGRLWVGTYGAGAWVGRVR